MRKFKVVCSILLSIILMTFIFMLSAQNSGESGSLSESIAKMIAMVFVPGFDSMELDVKANILNMLGFPVRKLAHATEYVCLATSLVNSCWQTYALIHENKSYDIDIKRVLARVAISAFIIAVIYACSDELHQLFIDGRSAQVLDVGIDSIGALFGSCIASLIAYRFLRKRMQGEKDGN